MPLLGLHIIFYHAKCLLEMNFEKKIVNMILHFLLPRSSPFSLHVPRAVATRDRGQAPLPQELRDPHHERRQSSQSGLLIAMNGEGLPLRGVAWTGEPRKLSAPPSKTNTPSLPRRNRVSPSWRSRSSSLYPPDKTGQTLNSCLWKNF